MDARRALAAAALVTAAMAAPALAQIPQIAPDVTNLKVTPKAFRALPSGGPVAAKGGALVTFKLDSGANVDFRVSALKPGRRGPTGCVKGTPKTTKQACTRRVPIPGGFTLIGIPGSNEIRFSGRIGDAALGPDAYLLIAKARGQAARSFSTTFKIVK
ncbi:MAG TPA: hypothetical protein VMT10_02830 [Solirubrobacteraceae bacterium]|nr:hypothetical protein [Solirubrobacteraceae bacterium]